MSYTRHDEAVPMAPIESETLPPRSNKRFAQESQAASRACGEQVTLQDGRELLLRPIQGTDVDAIRRCFTRLDPEEVRMRFMLSMRELPEPMAQRLCNINHEHEAAFVLMDEQVQPEELRGVSRIHIDETTNHAEFAILVERAWTGRGLGHLLMQQLIDECNHRGVDEIWGHVLTQNNPMLDLCRELGFKHRMLYDDPGMQLMSLPLD
jgi:RimJ/RimL family protein N-acetyltransferase